MKIITKNIGEPARVTEIEKLELADMQSLVGGLIQPIYMDDVICWCNEESKILGMDVNIALTASYMGEIVDTVHGNIFFTNFEEGQEGLDSRQIQSLLERLNGGLRTFARSDMHQVPIVMI